MKYNEKELNKKKKLLALERKNRIWEWLLSCVSMTREEKKLRKAYWKKKKSQERRSLSFFFFFSKSIRRYAHSLNRSLEYLVHMFRIYEKGKRTSQKLITIPNNNSS